MASYSEVGNQCHPMVVSKLVYYVAEIIYCLYMHRSVLSNWLCLCQSVSKNITQKGNSDSLTIHTCNNHSVNLHVSALLCLKMVERLVFSVCYYLESWNYKTVNSEVPLYFIADPFCITPDTGLPPALSSQFALSFSEETLLTPANSKTW